MTRVSAIRLASRRSSQPRAALAVATALLSAASCLAEDARPVAFTNATLEVISGETIRNGTLLIEGAKISAVGDDLTLPVDAERIDARGKVLMPGLVVPWSTLGLSGAPGGKPGNNAAARIADELYPFQDAYRFAAQAGITTLCLVPGGQGVSGQAAVCRPLAESGEGMLLSWWGPLVIDFRVTTACKGAIKGAFDAANKLLKDGEVPDGLSERDDALCRALAGERPTLVKCGGAGQLLHALPFFKAWGKLDLHFVCPGLSYLVAKELSEAKRAVILPTATVFAPETRDRVNPFHELSEAGVKVVCRPAGDSLNDCREIFLRLAQLTKSGVSREAALKSVTLGAAQAIGFDYRVGSLEAGKDANLLVLSGDPLSPTTRIERVMLDGKLVFEEGGEGE